jgi:hypothetical protein
MQKNERFLAGDGPDLSAPCIAGLSDAAGEDAHSAAAP